MKLAFVSVAVAVALCACKKPPPPVEKEEPAPSVSVVKEQAAPPKKTVEDLLGEEKTAKGAFELVRPQMSDVTVESELNKGGVLFARWASSHLTWADVYVEKDETSFGKIRKDSEEELGKRMCVSGSIIQIEVVKVGSGKVSTGLLMSNGSNIYHYVNARSSGELVERKYARMCGIVVGGYSYKNSGGGTSHGVDLVGIFDLPENKPAAQ